MKVKLTAVLSGNESKYPGEVIDLPQEEAERLIGLGAAKAVGDEAKSPEPPAAPVADGPKAKRK